MYIRRGYTPPVSQRNRPARLWQVLRRMAFVLGLMAGGVLLYAVNNPQTVGSVTMQMFGGAPPMPTALPGTVAQAALQAYRSGDTAGALALFESALAARPDDLDYLYEYGQMLIETGDPEQAITLGERAIEVDTFDPRGYALKGRGLVWRGDAAAAIPVALSGIAVDDAFAPLYAVLARAYADTGNYRAGLENGERAITLDSISPEPRRSYAYALGSAGATEEAVAQLSIALMSNPDFIPLYFELASYYLAADLDSDAIDLYDQVLVRQPNNARAMLRLCDTYRKVGDFDKSETECERAVRADPTYTVAQFRLGMIKYTNLDFEAARRAFQACVDTDAENLECYYRLGLTHYYQALDARTAEQRASQPTFAPTLTPQATPIHNEMLLMALSAVPSATPGVTLTPTVEVSSSAQTVWTFTAH
ncbi:MAG: tetratricopeptide repeat protein, partial [Armatimonadetes bacterium]|nr:tetratricopeptide repeat protein [Anaerolineae bacterium]